MVVHLWGKGENRKVLSEILVSANTGLEGPADTSLFLTLSCRPLIYQGQEEAAGSGTFAAGSILTTAAGTSHTTDPRL